MKAPITPIVLPTDDKYSPIYKWDLDTLYYNSTLEKCSRRGQNQHLYITVDQDVEPIKEGDWFISELGELWQHNGKVQPSKLARKIIETTDPKLKSGKCESCKQDKDYRHNFIKCTCKILQVQQSFIKEFVANPDGEYFVEYEIDKYDERNQYENVPSFYRGSQVKPMTL